MEATFATCKLSPCFAPPLISQPSNYSLVTKLFHIPQNSKVYKNPKLGQHGCGLAMGCAKRGGGISLEEMEEAKIKNSEAKIKNSEAKIKNSDAKIKNSEAKIKNSDAKIKKSDIDIEGKCQGKSGVVELMECLECEAIMGEDQGKEARDYNRRAQIFDKSAQVFQALKQETKECPTDD